MKGVIDREKGSKTQNEVKPVKNIIKNLQRFLDISPMQKEVRPSQNCKAMQMSNRILSD